MKVEELFVGQTDDNDHRLLTASLFCPLVQHDCIHYSNLYDLTLESIWIQLLMIDCEDKYQLDIIRAEAALLSQRSRALATCTRPSLYTQQWIYSTQIHKYTTLSVTRSAVLAVDGWAALDANWLKCTVYVASWRCGWAICSRLPLCVSAPRWILIRPAPV